MIDIDFDEQIKQIKISRSPEAYLEDIFMNITKYKDMTYIKQKRKFETIIYYLLNNKVIFEYEKSERTFYYDEKLKRYIAKKFKLSDNDIIQILMNNIKFKLKIKYKYICCIGMIKSDYWDIINNKMLVSSKNNDNWDSINNKVLNG